jgi:hypothetical protein
MQEDKRADISFFLKLRDYYVNVGQVLCGKAKVTSIFPNATDIGLSRENIYAKVLRQHLPSSCNVMLGGFLFNQHGRRSGQIDILISNQLSLRYDFENPEGGGKSFACVDGCIGVVSVKSTLTATTVKDALINIASVPDKVSMKALHHSPELEIPLAYYLDWPYKTIFAFDGWKNASTLVKNINKFYVENPDIPFSKRPNLVYIASKCVAYRPGYQGAITPDGTKLKPYEYIGVPVYPDVVAWLYTKVYIQEITAIASHLYPDYSILTNNVIDSIATYGSLEMNS